VAGLTPEEIVAALRMSPHPEGGAFAETWRDPATDGARGTGSAITFLLRSGQVSAWHRVDATEIWHFHAGAPVELRIAPVAGRPVSRRVVGADLVAGQRPQVVVPAGAWQNARSLGEWSLVGCTVSPAFTFEGFELAGAATVEALELGPDATQEGDVEGVGDGEALAEPDAGAPASSIL
jgi:predicted cupin superfamily sugar epimerase